MKYSSAALLGALMASTSMARSLENADCCTVYSKVDQGFGPHNHYCLSMYENQAAYDIDLDNLALRLFHDDHDDHASIKCGKNVDALICPDGFELTAVPNQRHLRYACYSANDEIHGFKVGANQQFIDFDVKNRVSSIILNKHIWTAKGEDYLSLKRDEKQDILWDKINENNTTNPDVNFTEVFNLHLDNVFDERGDEFDCRIKTIHPQGNVGKARWESVGSHPYTGIFEGADTGFVRLSTVLPIVEPGTLDDEGNPIELVMSPTMGIKFLRDGIESANAFSNLPVILTKNILIGQSSYNFFENSLSSILAPENPPLDDSVALLMKPVSNFVVSLGHSDFATYNQFGTKVQNPVFPYSLRYEPNPANSFPADTYDVSIFEQMQTIPAGLLYKVFAMDKPAALGGVEQHIGNLILESTLVTSFWGDSNMFFRHQRHDDDFRYHPEWIEHTPVHLEEGKENLLRPVQAQRASTCPFAFLFD